MAERKILVLGAGELGTAIATAILDHKAFDPTTTSLTISIRPQTLDNWNSLLDEHHSGRLSDLAILKAKNAVFIGIDLVNDSEDSLVDTFSRFTTIIHAGAMTLPAGTQMKTAKAVLAAKVPEFAPWQWGVDYDVIGPEAGGGLFAEAYNVRQLLRSQSHTKWWIVSCGIFMSFLFEEVWGVVKRDQGKVVGVRALGGWDHLVTATHVPDIAKANAQLVLLDRETRDRAVYIAGVTMRYDELADEIERVLERKISRELWTTDALREESERDLEAKLLQYRVVFSEDKGLAWEKDGTYADQRGLAMDWDIEKFMRMCRIE